MGIDGYRNWICFTPPPLYYRDRINAWIFHFGSFGRIPVRPLLRLKFAHDSAKKTRALHEAKLNLMDFRQKVKGASKKNGPVTIFMDY
jgi:hypothetical protein